jgi:hypothetical protein
VEAEGDHLWWTRSGGLVEANSKGG